MHYAWTGSDVLVIMIYITMILVCKQTSYAQKRWQLWCIATWGFWVL